MTTLDSLLALADEHLRSVADDYAKDNAAVCLENAVASYHLGRGGDARYWALRSLKWTLGILSPVYQRAVAMA
jgi:hypothetical protein